MRQSAFQLRRHAFTVLVTSALATIAFRVSPSFAQDAEPVPVASPAASAPSSKEGLYFADVEVRGRPIFQVGSLRGMDAGDRAATINRRISSLLTRSTDLEAVSVQLDKARDLATLQLNNRVLMTVTAQDAEDFGLSVEALAQKWAEDLNQALDKPPLAIDVVQRLNGTVRELLRDTVNNLPSLIGALIVVILTWVIAQAVRRIAFQWAQQTEGDRSTEILIGRLGYGGVWVLGSVLALGVMGLDLAALLGALGLTSVAIGFSLKDVLSNYISGVILLAARPFRIGDQVVIEDYEGTIAQVQLRGTTMTTYDGRVVYIPNQEVFQSTITNNTASTRRRSSVIVGIDYDADIATAISVIRDKLKSIEEVEVDPPLEVLVKELAASTVNLEVRFWVDSRRAGFLQATSKVTQGIKEALQAAKIEMPTDIYTIAIRNLPRIPIDLETHTPNSHSPSD
ncbi:MAG TPA: mechanosensitive ion channel family protein [Oscillatoriales cyanobacterium M59_W2019_021]|nr:MAG: mechanosensitive ion channel family protein [Cyanobacteria bacterium J055]HIK32988.1 mechanosensitive ion channel family protein [Oscillatoriales cyanobacterium M4454_W2019_049]HIK53524.1 mechanosensitive ion channel family protein [Oscillatoriales cyanobacterium M59_W2019_021]